MSQEYFITGTITLDTALHIGVGKGGQPTDQPLRRAGDGRLLIPGRALGGSLRTLATRLAPRLGQDPCQALLPKTPGQDEQQPCQCIVCQLFGDVHPVDPEDNKDAPVATASRLWVYDAFAAADTAVHVRDGVGIDRRKGTAAHNVKFDYETIPAGATFKLRLRMIADENAIETSRLLAAVLNEWEAGRGQLGGNVARGLGRFRLKDISCRQTVLETADDLVAYLAADDLAAATQPANEWWDGLLKAIYAGFSTVSDKDLPALSSFLKVSFTLKFDEHFLVHDPVTALVSGFNHAPQVNVIAAPGKEVGLPLISGSSLRGALRSHAEKIVRTLATNQVLENNTAEARETFLHRCPACDPLARNETSPLASCDTRLKIPDADETPSEALCLSCQLFGSQRRGSRFWVRDAHVKQNSLSANDWQAQDFLAIDRFTGGGQEGAKFDAAPLYQVPFETTLTLHDPTAWEAGWLALLMRDLADGTLTVGFGKAKGYGCVRAHQLKWTLGYLMEEDVSHLSATDDVLSNASPNGIYQVSTAEAQDNAWLPDAWKIMAEEWVQLFNDKVQSFQLEDNDVGWQPFSKDTFLTEDGRFMKLYGRSRSEVNDNE